MTDRGDLPTNYGDFALKNFLGMEVGDGAGGSATTSIEISTDHLNPNGVIHGGVLFTMVDTAMGKAAMSVLDDGQFCASVEVQLRFIRPASEGPLTATALVTKRGRTVIHLEARVTATDDRLIATSNGTFTVISFDPPSASELT